MPTTLHEPRTRLGSCEVIAKLGEGPSTVRDVARRLMTLTRRDDDRAEIAIELVPVDVGREPALVALHDIVRSEAPGMNAWAPAVRDQVLRSQYQAQWLGYRQQFPRAETHLVLREGSPIGWLTVDRSGDAVHLVDVALLPAQRSQGIGTQLVRVLQAEAAQCARPMRLAVHRFNDRALALYGRLGFCVSRETDADLFMEWKA